MLTRRPCRCYYYCSISRNSVLCAAHFFRRCLRELEPLPRSKTGQGAESELMCRLYSRPWSRTLGCWGRSILSPVCGSCFSVSAAHSRYARKSHSSQSTLVDLRLKERSPFLRILFENTFVSGILLEVCSTSPSIGNVDVRNLFLPASPPVHKIRCLCSTTLPATETVVECF